MLSVVAAILIAIGALIGILMAIKAIERHHVPKGLALLHGAAVFLGIILLLLYALTTEQTHKHWGSLVIFLVAAAGGIYILQRDIRHKRFPLWVMFMHGLIGLGGLIWLSVHLFRF